MWNYMKKNGLDVMLVALLTGCTIIIGGNALQDKPLGRAVLIVDGVAIYLLYVAKAWEAKTSKETFDRYKSTIYQTEVYASDVPKYMGNMQEDLEHLINQHKEKEGKGLYKHEVNYYRLNDTTDHFYITPLGLNKDEKEEVKPES